MLVKVLVLVIVLVQVCMLVLVRVRAQKVQVQSRSCEELEIEIVELRRLVRVIVHEMTIQRLGKAPVAGPQLLVQEGDNFERGQNCGP